nr:hypothetical protein Iba_scaffold17159.3CG0090 [Ipomoea batatas]
MGFWSWWVLTVYRIVKEQLVAVVRIECHLGRLERTDEGVGPNKTSDKNQERKGKALENTANCNLVKLRKKKEKKKLQKQRPRALIISTLKRRTVLVEICSCPTVSFVWRVLPPLLASSFALPPLSVVGAPPIPCIVLPLCSAVPELPFSVLLRPSSYSVRASYPTLLSPS